MRITNKNMKLSNLWRDQTGASAVEFSMLAPILFFTALVVADLGMGLRERMDMDEVIRSSASSAMVDAGEEKVLAVLGAAAKKNFNLADETSGDNSNTYQGGISYPLNISVNRFCACPDAPDTEVDCLQICRAEEPPGVFYDLVAEKTFPGMIIPDVEFASSMRVQIR
jgi:Flp pilus assembly pilin Flp